MILAILIYLLGVVLSWLMIAYANDWANRVGDIDNISVGYVFLSWIIIFTLIVGVILYSTIEGWDYITQGRFDYPSFSVFKRKKK